MVSGGILKSGTIITIRECNTEKSISRYVYQQEKLFKKTIRESGVFTESAVNRSRHRTDASLKWKPFFLKKEVNRSRGFYSTKYSIFDVHFGVMSEYSIINFNTFISRARGTFRTQLNIKDRAFLGITFFSKSSILDVWLGSECASESYLLFEQLKNGKKSSHLAFSLHRDWDYWSAYFQPSLIITCITNNL